MIKIIIFDFRGTTINTKFSYLNRNNYCWNYFINYCKIESIFQNKIKDALNKIKEEYKTDTTIHDWDRIIFNQLVKDNNYQISESDKNKLLATLEDIFITRIKPYQDALFLLNYCRNNNITTGVVIDGTIERENKILDMHNLRQYFNAITISEETLKNKLTNIPLINCMEKIKQKISFTDEEVLVIGDRIDKDIIPAKALHFKTALLEREDSNYTEQNKDLIEQYKPDMIIKSLTEIQTLLEKEARMMK